MSTTPDAPLPEIEEERLRAVFSHEVLDAEPQLELETLTRIASHAFSAPIALVTLDATRLWVTSRLDLAHESITRRLAFEFKPLTRSTDSVVIEDLTQDRRFQFNPLVTHSPHLRFVAGTPILDQQGRRPLGALAIIDTVPRSFSPRELG